MAFPPGIFTRTIIDLCYYHQAMSQIPMPYGLHNTITSLIPSLNVLHPTTHCTSNAADSTSLQLPPSSAYSSPTFPLPNSLCGLVTFPLPYPLCGLIPPSPFLFPTPSADSLPFHPTLLHIRLNCLPKLLTRGLLVL